MSTAQTTVGAAETPLPTYDDVESLYDKYSEFYDVCAATGRADLPLYLELSEGAGVTLDLGCGTGRVALPLLDAGRTVIGVDISPKMLQVFESKIPSSARDRVSLVQHDFCRAPFTSTFDLCILSWFTFNYVLSETDQVAMLRNVRRATTPGGVVVLDLFWPKTLAVGVDVWEQRDVVVQEEPLLTRHDRRRMSGLVEERTQTYEHDGERFTFESSRRFVSPAEIAALLRTCGFEVEWYSTDHGRTRTTALAEGSAASYVVVGRAV